MDGEGMNGSRSVSYSEVLMGTKDGTMICVMVVINDWPVREMEYKSLKKYAIKLLFIDIMMITTPPKRLPCR